MTKQSWSPLVYFLVRLAPIIDVLKNKNGTNWECLGHSGDLRFFKAGVQKPQASADVRGQDNVDCELYGSYFTNAVV